MFSNYLKIAFRNLLKYKAYSGINIAGLSIGIASVILIFLFVYDELSYDRFHTNSERIYRIVEKIDIEGQGEESSSNPFPVGPAVYNDYSHLIESYVRLFDWQTDALTFQFEDNRFNESGFMFADSTFFKIFDFNLVKGKKSDALNGPNKVVLTKAAAEKYFGNVDPFGKNLLLEGKFNLMVTGVIDKIPSQSHFNFDILISFSTINEMAGPNITRQWVWNPCWTYVLLKEGVNPDELESQFPAFTDKYFPEFIKPQVTLYLQPLEDIHLYSKLDYEIQPNGDIDDVYIFGLVGILILLIASINFMNLATARSANRAREVGMRKVLGATRSQLINQFLGESILLSIIAVFISLALVEAVLPLFNNFSGKSLSFNYFSNPYILPGLIILPFITGILAGVYPAFFLSSAEPVHVLKGKLRNSVSGEFFRKGLVVVQFTISIALIISTIIIYEQLNYMRNADLGFNKEQVVILPVKVPILPLLNTFETELKKNHKVLNVTTMNEIIGQHHNTHEFNYEGMEPGKWVYMPALIIDENFVQTFKIPIIAGRDFSKEYIRDDSLSIIINESMVKHLGWNSPNEAIGKRINTISGMERVVGVMKDFNFVSLEKPIGPFALDIAPKRFDAFFKKFIAVRIAAGDFKNTLGHIEEVWSSVLPLYPFEFSFLDENLNKMYNSQDNLGKLIGYFSAFAILIACLGLFALASFMAEKRTKEIGIRKVLGATGGGIVMLLSKDFLKLVLISNIIAFPVSYIIMNSWLESFAFRTNINFAVFVFAGLLVILIALVTVSYQAIKAALLNPVRSLKYE